MPTLPELLAERTRSEPDLQAVVTERSSITYRELDEASRALAARLVAGGVNKADRVALLMPNGIAWATTAFAVMRIGAVLVPLSTLLRPPELLSHLRTASVTHVLAVSSFRGRHYLADFEDAAPGVLPLTQSSRRHPLVPSLRKVWLLPADPEVVDAASGAAGEALPGGMVEDEVIEALEGIVRPGDDLVVLFTSGSRGAPKGVVHTHGNALRATSAGLEARCVRRGERLYIPMPLFWMGGFGGGLLTALVAGATLITEATPTPSRTLALLERERATLFRGWPDQAAKIAADPAFPTADLSSLRPGSLPAVLPADQRPAPGARANLFGMTESFGPYAADPLDRDMPPGKLGSCGRPFPGVEVRIAGHGRDGPDGEIWLRGPHLMRGICGHHRSDVFTPDGWYRTRDLGRLDEDGYLWFDGRLDDMFKVKGATVYPSEVEAALREIPGVAQAFVTNVPADDGRDEVGALVVSALDPTELAAEAKARLSAFKVPTVWLANPDPEAVPLTPTAKVDTHELRRRLQAERYSPDPD